MLAMSLSEGHRIDQEIVWQGRMGGKCSNEVSLETNCKSCSYQIYNRSAAAEEGNGSCLGVPTFATAYSKAASEA